MSSVIGIQTDIYIRQIAGIMEYSLDQASWTTVNFPIGINNVDASSEIAHTIIFTTDLTLTGTNDYFYPVSDYINFGKNTLNSDGTKPKISVDGVTNYPGVFQNGTIGADGKNFIKIQNIDVESSGSTLAGAGGWIAQNYFAKNATFNTIENCSSTGGIDGAIGFAKGGIVGSNAAYGGGFLSIIACSSTGEIGYDGGGIIGELAGKNGGTVSIDRCWSSGNITANGGGIVGQNATGFITITSCYSSGIIGTDAGGIVGKDSSNNSLSISNCYSTGLIGDNAGGIVGRGSIGIVNVSNCYTTGVIGPNNSGGIFGADNTNSLDHTANNCYTSGVCGLAGTGGIFGGSSSDTRPNSANNYSEGNQSSSGWKDSNALSVLSMKDWVRPFDNDTPFLLKTSNYSPYSLSLVDSVSSTVITGGATNPSLVPGFSSYILTINGASPMAYPFIIISPSTGIITASADTPADVYELIVYSIKNPYSITEYTLTVEAAPSESGVCCQPIQNVQFTAKYQIQSGQRMLRDSRTTYPSYDSYYQMKKARSFVH